jgi:hypothetical protein
MQATPTRLALQFIEMSTSIEGNTPYEHQQTCATSSLSPNLKEVARHALGLTSGYILTCIYLG